MARPKPGMGRGLSAILSGTGEGEDGAGQELRELPVELIAPNPQQPRRRFDQASLEALAESVRDTGVLQPVLVRPRPGGRYELVAGERRWRAAKLADLDKVPALVQAREDSASLELALIENMVREDLNPVEEARACAALVEELGLTREEVGRRIGRSRVSVSNLMRLLELPDEAIEMLEEGLLTEGHGRALLLAEDHESRRRLARECRAQQWSVRVLEEQARESNAKDGSRKRAGQSAGGAHPDQLQAAADIAATLGRAFGAEVKVKPTTRGYRAEMTFTGPDEALELAQRFGAGD